MTAYHQMGHDSKNLLRDVAGFAGAIISPVNETEEEARAIITEHGTDAFEFVFDPQLYFPRNSGKGKLNKWGYFPTDFETADHSSQHWWDARLQAIADTALGLGVKAVCSPAFVPQTFPDEYYERMRQNADGLASRCATKNVRVLSSVIVKLTELSAPTRAMEIATVVSNTKAAGVYLILLSDTKPREELSDEEQLKGAMRLIRALEGSGMPVLVSCASSDVVLWKAAGASACATGKFANLRRFSTSRFSDDDSSGRQMSYWFEERLLAFIRQSDIVRVQKHGIATLTTNPYGQEILAQISVDPEAAWVALGWRQYMHWFASMEARLATSRVDPVALVKDAESSWDVLSKHNVYLEERANAGAWLRPWLRALVEFDQ